MLCYLGFRRASPLARWLPCPLNSLWVQNLLMYKTLPPQAVCVRSQDSTALDLGSQQQYVRGSAVTTPITHQASRISRCSLGVDALMVAPKLATSALSPPAPKALPPQLVAPEHEVSSCVSTRNSGGGTAPAWLAASRPPRSGLHESERVS